MSLIIDSKPPPWPPAREQAIRAVQHSKTVGNTALQRTAAEPTVLCPILQGIGGGAPHLFRRIPQSPLHRQSSPPRLQRARDGPSFACVGGHDAREHREGPSQSVPSVESEASRGQRVSFVRACKYARWSTEWHGPLQTRTPLLYSPTQRLHESHWQVRLYPRHSYM